MVLNEQVAAGGTGVLPSPSQQKVPGNGVYITDPQGGGITIIRDGKIVQTGTQALGGLQPGGSTGNGARDQAAGVAYLKSLGIDYGSLPSMSGGDVADLLGNASKLGLSFSNVTDLNGLSSLLKTPSGPGTTATINATPGAQPNPTDIAASTAAQTQQLAGDQGMNVTQTTTPEGVAAVQKTPLGTPAAQTQTTSGVSTQTPSTSGAAAGAYNGTSIVDYLTSVGQPSDFLSRSVLAAQHGITGYTGTAAQNLQLLGDMRKSQGQTSSSGITSAPTQSANTTQTSLNASGQTQVTDKYAGLDPVQKQVQMYTDAYKALGLSTIKDQYDSYMKEQSDLTDKMNEEIANTRNNPWLSQGIADKTIQRIEDKYATKLDSLTHLLTLTDSMYKQGQAQVETLVSNANADIKATNDLAQKQLDAANALAKDNIVVIENGRQFLVSKETGKKVADLGVDPNPPKITTTSTGTAAERQQAEIDKLGSLFAPGTTIPSSGGIPFLDSNGNATPEGWKAAMNASTLPRTTFIKEFGNLIVNNGGTVSPKYGLTPVEIKSLTGAL